MPVHESRDGREPEKLQYLLHLPIAGCSEGLLKDPKTISLSTLCLWALNPLCPVTTRIKRPSWNLLREQISFACLGLGPAQKCFVWRDPSEEISSTSWELRDLFYVPRPLCHGHRRRHQIQEVVIEKKGEKQMFNIQNWSSQKQTKLSTDFQTNYFYFCSYKK